MVALLSQFFELNAALADVWSRVPNDHQTTTVSTIGPDGIRRVVVAQSEIEWNSKSNVLRTHLTVQDPDEFLEILPSAESASATRVSLENKQLVYESKNPFITIKMRYRNRQEVLDGVFVIQTQFRAPLTAIDSSCAPFQIRIIPPAKPPPYLFQIFTCDLGKGIDPRLIWQTSEDIEFRQNDDKNRLEIRLSANLSPFFPESQSMRVTLIKPAVNQSAQYEIKLVVPPRVRPVFSWGLMSDQSSYSESYLKMTNSQWGTSAQMRYDYPVMGPAFIVSGFAQSSVLPLYQSSQPSKYRAHWHYSGRVIGEWRFSLLNSGLFGGVSGGYSAVGMWAPMPQYGANVLGGPGVGGSLYWKRERGRLLFGSVYYSIFGSQFKRLIYDSRVQLEVQYQLTHPQKDRPWFLVGQAEAWNFALPGNWYNTVLKRQSFGLGIRWEY